MKKLLVFWCLWAAGFTARGQELHIDSTRFITGNNCCTFIRFSLPTADGGLLFVGQSASNIGGIVPDPAVPGLNNVLIGKLDNGGRLSWVRTYGGNYEDVAYGACQTADGGYAVLALSESNSGDVTGFKGGNDIWLLRLDAMGMLLWQKTYGGPAGEQPASIANTPDHGFVILGTSNGAGGDIPLHYGGMFSQDWVVIKTDSMGNRQWLKVIGGTGDESTKGSIMVAGDGYYLASSSSSKDYDCNDASWHIGVDTHDDYYLLKMDTTGNLLWAKSYGGSGGEYAMQALYDIRDSTIMMTGNTWSSDYMITGLKGYTDAWLIKVNTEGGLIWAKTIGDSSEQEGNALCFAKDGGYIVCSNTRYGPIGSQDIWLSVLDKNGNELSSKIAGGKKNDNPAFVSTFGNGCVIAGGSVSVIFTEGTTNGKVAPNSNAFLCFVSEWALGIPGIGKENALLELYPNPATSIVQLELPVKVGGEITITRMDGRNVYSRKITQHDGHIVLETNNWAKGLYLARWIGDDGDVAAAKLVIE